MFCTQCGTNLPDSARFCSGCGTQLQTITVSTPNPLPSIGAYYPSPSPSAQPSTGSYIAPTPPPPSSNLLVSSTGLPLPPFQALAAAIFNGLDGSVEPRNTRGMEVSKVAAFRTMTGLQIPPYFREQVLPCYYAAIGAETVPKVTPQVLTYNGWYTFLLHKVTFEPENTYGRLLMVLRELGISFQLQRSDLPLHPSVVAQANENKFRRDIYAIATQAGLASGGLGYAGALALSSSSGVMAQYQASQRRQSMIKILGDTVKIGGALVQNASSPGSGPWTFS